MSADTIQFTWDDIAFQADEIEKKVIEVMGSERINCIVALCRGGAVLGTILSYKFNVPVKYIDFQSQSCGIKHYSALKQVFSKRHNTVLVVDDILDTGNTIKEVMGVFNETLSDNPDYRAYYAVGCARKKKLVECFTDVIVGEIIPDEKTWVYFPY